MTSSSGYGSDLEAYNPSTDKWILTANLLAPRYLAVGFSIGNRGYIATGQDGGGRRKDFWKYSPCSYFPSAAITASGSLTICQGSDVTLTANAGTSYIWWTSETTQSIVVSTGGAVAVTVTDSCGIASSSPVTITVVPAATISASGNATVCANSCTTLSASGGISYSWNPSAQTGSSVSVCPTVTTTYTVTGTNANGCTYNDTITVTAYPVPVITLGGNTTVCAGQSTTLCASGGVFYSWSTSATTSCIVVSPTANTTYTIIVSDGTCSDTANMVVAVDSIIASLTLVPDTANPLLWYGYPSITGGSPVQWSWDFGDGNFSAQQYPSHTYSVTGNYIVCLTVTDANGCTDMSCDTTYKVSPSGLMQTLVIVNPLSGIADLQNTNTISIYPNPANGLFTVQSSAKIQNAALKNLLGETIMETNNPGEKFTMDISSLERGVYFVRIKTDKGIAVKKIVKQ